MRTAILIAALFGLLIASGWFVVSTWVHLGEGPMPTFLIVALAAGVGFSLLIGCGLMALTFYSSRHGYDDEAGRQREANDNDD
jgi:hypothetical protein